MSRRPVVLISGLVVLSAGLMVRAQQQPPIFRTAVDLVHLDVSVLDKDRRPVRGLTAADFTVFEDDKPQNIAAFTAVDVPENPPKPAAWSGRAPADVQSNEGTQDPGGRLFVLLLDDAMIPPHPGSLATARDVAKKFLDRVTPADRVAVVFSESGRNQDFTNDRARLLAAIDSLKSGYANHLGGWDTITDPVNPALPGNAAPGINIPGPITDPDIMYRQASVRTLRQVAETLISAPQRRKALIFISPGIAVDPASATMPVKNTNENPTRVSMKDANLQLIRDMPELFLRMKRANVTIYPVDPCGAGGFESYVMSAASSIPALRVDSEMPPTFFDWLNPGSYIPRPEDLAKHMSSLSVDFLETAASNTGGVAVVNTNDFTAGLDRIFVENSSYYLIGYEQPGAQPPGSLHRLTVRVNNRPDVTVRTRSGYETPTPPKAPKAGKSAPVVSPLNTAITGAVPDGTFPMRVALAPFVLPGKKDPSVTIALGLAQPAVSKRTTYLVDLQTNAYTIDGRPKLVGQRHTASVVLVPTDDETPARYDLLTQVSLPPGRYQLRFSAHNGSDNVTGSLYADLEVPDFSAPLAVSGVVVETIPAGATAPVGAFDNFLPVVPTSERHFTKQQDVTVFMRIYQGGGGSTKPVEVKTRMLNEFDAPVGEGRDIVYGNEFHVGGRAADYRFGIPVKSLPPGLYLLTFDISLDGNSVQRTVQFSVAEK